MRALVLGPVTLIAIALVAIAVLLFDWRAVDRRRVSVAAPA